MSAAEHKGLAAAVLLLGPERGHALLGCDWGTKVALPGDQEVCIRQAARRLVLHGPDSEIELKACDEHADVLERETDPHTPRHDGGTAMSSLISDLDKHEGTASMVTAELMMLFYGEVMIDGVRGARRFIDGLPRPAEQAATASRPNRLETP